MSLFLILSNGNKITNVFCLVIYLILVESTNQVSFRSVHYFTIGLPYVCRRTWMQPASWKIKITAVAGVDRPYLLVYPKDSFRLRVAESNFPEWLQSHIRYGDAAISNARRSCPAIYMSSIYWGPACTQDRRLWTWIYPWISTENQWIWIWI